MILTMDQIRTIIDALGGPTAVSRMCGCTPEAVCNWKRRGKLPRMVERYLRAKRPDLFRGK